MYSIKTKSQIVSEGIPSPFNFLIHDKPRTGQELLQQYLDEARTIFKSECDILLATDREFTATDADRLTIMLKLLMDARTTWQEEENDMRRKIAPAKA